MLTHDQFDIAPQKGTVPVGSTVPPPHANQLPEPSRQERSERREPADANPPSSQTRSVSEAGRTNVGRAHVSTRSSFGLEQIRTVAFHCGRCRTVVRFPRIRWANFPECCPNCGARWMTRPTGQSTWSEDTSTYVFRVVRAFREALQALAGMERTAVFTLALETGEYPNDGDAPAAANGRNGKSRD